MKNLLLAAALVALASLAGGCTLYFGDDAPGDDCYYGDDYAGDAISEAASVRNPETGTCEDWGWGGGGCYGGAAEAYPDWASCYGGCEALDETTCLATSACRAAYLDNGYDDCTPDGDCGGGDTFYGCWGTAPSGPLQGGACEGLDAYTCSLHDDCTAHYTGTEVPGEDGFSYATSFSYCAPEPWTTGCYSDMDCGVGYECNADTVCGTPPGCGDSGEADSECPAVCYGQCVPAENGCEAVDCGEGYHCELQCYPCDDAGDSPDAVCEYPCTVTCVPDESWTCEAVECEPGSHCEEVCTEGGGGGMDPGPPGACWSQCVPDFIDPGTCTGDVWCDSLPPTCPMGTVPGISGGCWSGFCIPETDCGPSDPGTCYGPVTDDQVPPSCPDGSTPGVLDGSYTGYCIPTWACEGGSSCESITDEAACEARDDCLAAYQGYECTCYPDGTCGCSVWYFSRCESAVIPF